MPRLFIDRAIDAVTLAIRDSGDIIFTTSQRIVPVDTGMLKKSGYRKNISGGFEFGYRTPYATKVNSGSKGGWELVKAHTVKAHTRKGGVHVKAHRVSSFWRNMPPTRPRYYMERSLHDPSGLPSLARRIQQHLAVEFA